MNLIDIAQLRALCARMGVDYVTCKGDALMMRFSIAADIDLVRVLTAVKRTPSSSCRAATRRRWSTQSAGRRPRRCSPARSS